MAKSTVKIDLSGLEKLQKKLKEYEQPKNYKIPYSKEQWEQMTDYEKEQVKEQIVNEYKSEIIKDLQGK